MDLGLAGKTALLCASSKGLGHACATALAREGCIVVINGRNAARLEHAAAMIAQETGHTPSTVVADIATKLGREALIAACPDPDILVTNIAGPEPGRFIDWDEANWEAAVEALLIAPIMLIRAVLPGMRRRQFGRIINITSAMVTSPKLPMALSAAPRSGVTAVAKALAQEVARDNVTVNNLLPERIDTDRLRHMTQRLADLKKISFDDARAEMVKPVAAGRFGTPQEFADACAYLCSAQAGYISGQNLHIDGASYGGLI